MAFKSLGPVSVPPDQIEQVKALQLLLKSEGSTLIVGKDESFVELSGSLRQFIIEVVRSLQQGDAVSVVSIPQELTAHQAAEVLGVPHAFIRQLIDSDQLPSSPTGALRRIRLTDLLAYKDRQRQLRLQALEELVRYDEELGLSGTILLPPAESGGVAE